MKRPDQKFLIIFLSCSLIAVFSIGAFNYLMDPFEYFETPIFFGMNEKMQSDAQERFDRALKIMVVKPKAIMFGSSRVHAGFPVNRLSQLVGYPVYKAAFSGARFNEINGYFEHALHNQPDLKAVFIGLDFFAFSKNLDPVTEYTEDRLRKSSPSLIDLFRLFLSYATLKYSYATYKHNLGIKKAQIEDRTRVKVNEDNMNVLVVKKNDLPQDFLKNEKKGIFDNYVIDPKKIEMFRRIVLTCKERNIDLKVIFCAAHAHYWETIFQSGCWNDFEDLKRQLCGIYPIHDFSGFSSFNTEPLSEDVVSNYFFEVSHFTPFYGTAILDKIYGIEDRCPNAGFLLTKDTVEGYLKTQREQRETWVKNNPDKVAWIRKHLELTDD